MAIEMDDLRVIYPRMSRKQLAALVAEFTEDGVFTCRTCWDIFCMPVWHCPLCDHHWEMHRDDCWNCHKGKRPGLRRWLYVEPAHE